MIIAHKKRKENIAEYVLYMFQVEDMMRACNCDFETVKQRIISQYNQPPEVMKDIEYWYDNIIALMKNEGVEQKGHLREVLNIIDDMHDLHLRLLRSPLHPDYKAAYQDAAPVIGQSIQKTQSNGVSEIEVCVQMMYMILLLKLQHKEISGDTMFGVQKISKMLAILSAKYKMWEDDKLEL
ncbi:MAG: DUF4924 family protein [Bacteroidales bacterium]|jgi:hypothetical protein|nr:DUF4924 family protein [Bacteroidales bacterium]MBQ3617640.1 DUF4924 family protein [Bacteroidales bacterium]MDD6001488.1 DUF4924 family protein [Bacteroidales bacterium]